MKKYLLDLLSGGKSLLAGFSVTGRAMLQPVVTVQYPREKLQVPSGQRHELCRGLHAEQNAIIQAAAHGISIQGAMLFCTTLPCSICLKMLINAGITTIVYEDGYADDLTQELLQEAAITITRFQPQGEGL